MSANFRNGYMRRLRQYTFEVNKLLSEQEKAIRGMEQYKGSTYYDEQVKSVEDSFDAKRSALKKAAISDLQTTLDSMRISVKQRGSKAPTTEMTASLQILTMLDSISPTELSFCAESMAECPLAMKALQQIAAKHNQKIQTFDADNVLYQINILEDLAANYLQNYIGNISKASASIKDLNRFFLPEDDYMNARKEERSAFGSAEKADKSFLQHFLNCDSSDSFEDGIVGSKPKVQYFFKSLEGVLDYLHTLPNGLDVNSTGYEKIVDDFFENCPDDYGAAYRQYKANGEKAPINVSQE